MHKMTNESCQEYRNRLEIIRESNRKNFDTLQMVTSHIHLIGPVISEIQKNSEILLEISFKLVDRVEKLEEDNRMLKEDNRMLKEDNRMLKEDNRMLKEDNRMLKEDKKKRDLLTKFSDYFRSIKDASHDILIEQTFKQENIKSIYFLAERLKELETNTYGKFSLVAKNIEKWNNIKLVTEKTLKENIGMSLECWFVFVFMCQNRNYENHSYEIMSREEVNYLMNNKKYTDMVFDSLEKCK
jgi:hypothetical protein